MKTRRPRAITRAYPGGGQHDAVRRFAVDARALAAQGYRVVSSEWAAAGDRAAVTPGVLAPRHGTLTVTYAVSAQPTPVSTDLLRVSSPGVAAELIDLLTARAEGIIDDAQFSTMRRRLVRAE